MNSKRTTGTARVAREWEVIEKRVHLYCRREHHSDALCERCQQLLEAYRLRLRDCRYRSDKPICANCAFHCFIPTSQEMLKTVIGATKPQMALRHPALTLRHWIDSFHRAPTGMRIDYSSWGAE